MVDCTGHYGNQGCNGGYMTNAYKYVIDKGIVTESEYPYIDVERHCSTDGGPFKISSFTEIKNCNDLSNAIMSRPVSIAVDASSWTHYRTGVFSKCTTTLNHGVLLVGIKKGNWHVKNSWGTSWGEKGYILLAGGQNTCGICSLASYPSK